VSVYFLGGFLPPPFFDPQAIFYLLFSLVSFSLGNLLKFMQPVIPFSAFWQ
jgi:hypothetical protein